MVVGRHGPQPIGTGRIRGLEALRREGWRDAELVSVDVLDPDSLRLAMRGVQEVYFLVHLMGYGRDLRELERHAAQHVADVAAACGVRRIVYLGALAPPDPHSEHILARHETG